MKKVELAAEQVVISEGAMGDELFVVDSGKLKC